jgi:hypothetical protein
MITLTSPDWPLLHERIDGEVRQRDAERARDFRRRQPRQVLVVFERHRTAAVTHRPRHAIEQ